MSAGGASAASGFFIGAWVMSPPRVCVISRVKVPPSRSPGVSPRSTGVNVPLIVRIGISPGIPIPEIPSVTIPLTETGSAESLTSAGRGTG